jgi:2-methylisocitrate lyase-like PEP mutase family enzyme
MNTEALRHMAKLLRELHADGTLVLPNAWDAASAAVIADAGPGRPTVAQLSATGVRRVSVGPALTQAAYTVTRQLAGELLSAGQLTADSQRLDYASLNSLFSTPDLVEG